MRAKREQIEEGMMVIKLFASNYAKFIIFINYYIKGRI